MEGIACIIKMKYIHQFSDPHHFTMIALKTECQDADIRLTCKLFKAAQIYVNKLYQGLVSIQTSNQRKDFEFLVLSISWKYFNISLNIMEVNRLDLLLWLLI